MVSRKDEFKKLNLKIVRKRRLAIIAGVLAVILAVSVVAGVNGDTSSNEDVTYKETTVSYGSLTVGITESGSVDIGTIEQTFDLDLSAYVSASSSSTSGMGGGGMNGFAQMMSMLGGGSGSSSSSGSTLEIATVEVTAGQSVEVGDVLYTLTDDSITDIRDQMEADVESAKADLDSITADNTISRVTARNTYNTAIAYGEYAQTEYDLAVQELEEAITDIEEQIAVYEEENADLEEENAKLQEQYETAQYAATQFEYTVNHTDDIYNYVTYEDLRETYQAKADSYEEKIEANEETIENNNDKIEELQADLAKAQRELESGTLKAQEQYNLRMLSYSTASEAYDVSIASLDLTEKEQRETYEDALEKLKEFDSSISGGNVIAEYAGIVTEASLAAGDTITTGTTLLTIYDQTETTITVSVSATDLKSLELGGAANIVFTAYPDTVYTGSITEIGDSSTDSSGNITYEITVTIDGDTSGLYQDMTGDLTFITKETEEVTYVSNRAIFREGTRSYVKMYDESGNIVEKEVTTGFSDGENVEIISGLSEGDVVLIEG